MGWRGCYVLDAPLKADCLFRRLHSNRARATDCARSARLGLEPVYGCVSVAQTRWIASGKRVYGIPLGHPHSLVCLLRRLHPNRARPGDFSHTARHEPQQADWCV